MTKPDDQEWVPVKITREHRVLLNMMAELRRVHLQDYLWEVIEAHIPAEIHRLAEQAWASVSENQKKKK